MADGSSKSHGCKKLGSDKTRIHLFSGPMAERRNIPSFWIGARLDWDVGQAPRLHLQDWHQYEAPHRQRLRYESTLYMRSVDSNKQAGLLCQRPDHKSSTDALVSLQRAQSKGVPHIPMHLKTRQSNTLDPAVQQHLEWLTFNWKTYFSSSSSWDHQWQEWHSQEWQDKRQERQRQIHGQTQETVGEQRGPDSGNCHERHGACTDNTSQYAHTRTFSRCGRHMWLHVWFKGLTILCVSRKVTSSLVMSLLNVPSTPLPPVFSPSTATPTPLTGIRPNPCATPLWGEPSGHLADPNPKHRSRAQVLHRCQ